VKRPRHEGQGSSRGAIGAENGPQQRAIHSSSRLDELAGLHRLPDGARRQLEDLLEALAAEPDPHTTVALEDAVDVHIADSLAGLEVDELRAARRIADLGAGAGFPGLPLAIALPRARVDLIESSRRKAELIVRLAGTAAAANARAIAARAEDVALGDGRGAYDSATVRAVAPLAVLVEFAAPLLRIGGVLVAWKGQREAAEEDSGVRAAQRVGLELSRVIPVRPYPASLNRHLHVYVKTSPTPERFPRRPGVAAKRPLG